MIKYRVWDKRCKIYLDIVGAELGRHNTKFCGFKYVYLKPQNKEVEIQNPIPLYGGCVGFKLTDSTDANRLIFEQYTGLKDVHGKDIYEGDIVTYHPHHEGVPYKVYWADVSAKFLIGRKGIIGQELTGRIALEVIGNIHENAELLEAKDE